MIWIVKPDGTLRPAAGCAEGPAGVGVGAGVLLVVQLCSCGAGVGVTVAVGCGPGGCAEEGAPPQALRQSAVKAGNTAWKRIVLYQCHVFEALAKIRRGKIRVRGEPR